MILIFLMAGAACGNIFGSRGVIGTDRSDQISKVEFDFGALASGCYASGEIKDTKGQTTITVVRNSASSVTDSEGQHTCPANQLLKTKDGVFIDFHGGVQGDDYSFVLPQSFFGSNLHFCINVEAIGWGPNRAGGSPGYSTWAFDGNYSLWSIGTLSTQADSIVMWQGPGGAVPMALRIKDSSNTLSTHGMSMAAPVAPSQGALGQTFRTVTTIYQAGSATATVRNYIDGLEFGSNSGSGAGNQSTIPQRIRIGYDGDTGQWGGFISNFTIAASSDMSRCYTDPGASRTVIALGDSHMTSNVEDAFPLILAIKLGKAWRVRHYGIAGDSIDNMRVVRWPDLRGRDDGWLLIGGGLNDLTPGFPSARRTAQAVCDDHVAISEDARLLGKKVVIASIDSCVGFWACDAETEIRRQAANTCIIAYVATRPGQVAFANVSEIVNGPGCATTGTCALLLAYDSGDHTHKNNAGTQVFRDVVYDAMATLGGVP